MTEFTASNGITVFVRDGGTVQFQHGTRDESCGILSVFPHSEWWQTLREFFQHERDEALGRWRWPENPEFVVYPHREGFRPADEDEPFDLFIINEVWGASLAYVHAEAASYEEPDMPMVAAANAYYAAHPEPKPWDNAAEGELWLLRAADATNELPYVVVRATVGEMNAEPRFFRVPAAATFAQGGHAFDFVAGHRIYPEGNE